jgi:hypothetical protein
MGEAPGSRHGDSGTCSILETSVTSTATSSIRSRSCVPGSRGKDWPASAARTS